MLNSLAISSIIFTIASPVYGWLNTLKIINLSCKFHSISIKCAVKHKYGRLLRQVQTLQVHDILQNKLKNIDKLCFLEKDMMKKRWYAHIVIKK